MSKEDLQNFIVKVKQLNALLDSLEKVPSRKAQLEACEDHEQVVSLAKEWGFEIGKRWGEYST